ncbi:hypothetical protein [Cupriavidus pinatubonensis]|uniref:hypothetical protein n=1 Tax=Cupriavidus pinatubonensis TaxID=248026 RepID=UPI00360F3C15
MARSKLAQYILSEQFTENARRGVAEAVDSTLAKQFASREAAFAAVEKCLARDPNCRMLAVNSHSGQGDIYPCVRFQTG